MQPGQAPRKRDLQGEGGQLDKVGIRNRWQARKKSKQDESDEQAWSAELKTAGSKAMAKPNSSNFRKGFTKYLDTEDTRIKIHREREVNSEALWGLVMRQNPRHRSDTKWDDMDDESVGPGSWADGADNAHPVCTTAASKDDPSRDDMIIGLTNHGGAAEKGSTRGQRRIEHIVSSVDMIQGLLEINAVDYRQIITFDPKSHYKTGGVWTGTALHHDMCVVGLQPWVAEVRTLKAGQTPVFWPRRTRWLIAEVCFQHTVCGMKTLRAAWPANDA